MLLPTSININGNEWEVKFGEKNEMLLMDNKRTIFINRNLSFIEQKAELLKCIVFETYMSQSRTDISPCEVSVLNILSSNIFKTIYDLGFLNESVDFHLLSAKKWGD